VTTLACDGAYGSGGLGRHFAELIEETRARGKLEAYYCPAPKPDDPAGITVRSRLVQPVLTYTPARLDPGWRTYIGGELFDRAVARSIEDTERHIGFSGQALHTFDAVRADSLELVSPTAHVDRLTERYQSALRTYPIERPWLNQAGRRKALAEYRRADTILIGSEYTRESFLEAGISPEKLRLVHFSASERYRPAPREQRDDTLRVIYVGALTVAKGVPVLLEAFRALPGDAELHLVGGWTSRGMRRFVQAHLAADPRIRVITGDPLDELRRADVLVHPSFSDGFGYAPMEALACGLPVVVTEDTGMKEHVREGINGWIIPTGSVEALLERLTHLRDRSLQTGRR
jgi:glycosyltransferase involved in cell wall biosynthesis